MFEILVHGLIFCIFSIFVQTLKKHSHTVLYKKSCVMLFVKAPLPCCNKDTFELHCGMSGRFLERYALKGLLLRRFLFVSKSICFTTLCKITCIFFYVFLYTIIHSEGIKKRVFLLFR